MGFLLEITMIETTTYSLDLGLLNIVAEQYEDVATVCKELTPFLGRYPSEMSPKALEALGRKFDELVIATSKLKFSTALLYNAASSGRATLLEIRRARMGY